MNKKIISFVLIILLVGIVIILTGCSKTNNSNVQVQENIDEHLLNVLNGKEKFKYSIEKYDGILYYDDSNVGLDFYITEIPYISDDIAESPIKDYTLVDIDGDSQNEIVANINHLGGFILILHYENNINYGYVLSVRTFNNLKEDGKFLSSNSDENKSIHKAEFNGEYMNIKTIAYGDSINFYNAKDEKITEEEFNKYLNEFNNSKDVKFITLD